ncbi:M9 family metallopeptidase [Pseudoalteromonas sp. OOF1S-7]|uniref:M9 family metallopeptidase n=1 Tax=Pseudoalteromonas sp. OOF1S-7 TaxID=2917757 RepID=UPI001EF73A64|nr:M9 family metallopeptidase [Pseudoalteromonas sp. OOF1S-7]MCG7534868.1 M9 family metallopeptidase [Pseudoalteromonas sp. OOF1S-7]
MYKVIKMTPLVIALSSASGWAQGDRETATPINDFNGADVAHIHVDTEYKADAMHSNRQITPKSELPFASRAFMSFSNALSTSTSCPDEVFSHLSGSVFLEAIRNHGRVCIDTLFNDRPETLTLGAYTDANFATVINELNTRLVSYDGQSDVTYLSDLFYWLKAYSYYDFRRFVNPTTQQAMVSAINTLYANEHFFDKTETNAQLIRSATGIIKNAQIGQFLVSLTLGLLARYDESYEHINDWGRSATPLFWQVLNDCARDTSCRSQQHTDALIDAITGFINDNLNWLSKPANDYHLFNLGYQLVNFYRGKQEPHFAQLEPKLRTEITRILNNYGPLKTDRERTLYLAVLESINYNRQCDTYAVCDKAQEIITQVLGNRLTCPSGNLFIWAQDMTATQLAWSCNSLKVHEDHFHQLLRTDRVPVTPDDNDSLRMVIFNDKKEWVTYGGVLFNVSTSNGGTYREGDPSKPGDQATFYAYEHVSERPVFDIWNLRHEYVHYLEGRYISKGDFNDSNSAGRTVWFGEGIAEYSSLKNCNPYAVEEARKGTYSLSTIFSNEYGVGQTRIYDWGYLATRFMYEQQYAAFFDMLTRFKDGDFSGYRSELVDKWVTQKLYDDQFSNWLTQVESTGCVTDTTRPPSPVEPVNVDDIQGSDQVGINACGVQLASDRTQAGQARCLSGTDTRQLKEYPIYVPEGLQNVSLEITLRHGTGNADLYYEYGRPDNGWRYSHESTGPNNDETLVLDNIEKGWHYIAVGTETGYQDATLLARYIQQPIADENELQNGVAVPVNVSDSGQLMYTMAVPAGATNVTFSTTGGTGELDLHVKFGSEASKTDYDCRPWKVGNRETCHFSTTSGGVYYILLSADPMFSGATQTGRYDVN